ncbi:MULTISPECIES: hypothetical protein [Pseudomonas]|uniref:Uncharacterized protein n=2 Tax=Pseudomonas TaxID=286 RepID=A0AA94EV75_9PSED|nr:MULTISPECIES: hypothetical protein [Pseudomonas]RVD79902.1 hypothetical protein A9HBioS_0426 [Pseudomonas koreensis]WDR35545.1 hypothetical protein NN484_24120 [Pseudomonas serboccidentalis]
MKRQLLPLPSREAKNVQQAEQIPAFVYNALLSRIVKGLNR